MNQLEQHLRADLADIIGPADIGDAGVYVDDSPAIAADTAIADALRDRGYDVAPSADRALVSVIRYAGAACGRIIAGPGGAFVAIIAA